MIKFEYGAVSSKFQCEAENKLTAYATMCMHYHSQPNLVAIYSPEEYKKDSWMSFDGKCADRLDEVFGGENGFDKYVEANADVIRACYKTIKRLV